MAQPTVWGFGAGANAGVSRTWPIEGTNLYACDLGGAITPRVITLGTGMQLVLTTAVTPAQVVAAMKAYIQARGEAHDGAGRTDSVLPVGVDNAPVPTTFLTS